MRNSFTAAFWMSEGVCNITSRCPNCFLDAVARMTGRTPVPLRNIVEAFKEALSMRAVALARGFRLDFAFPGKEPTLSPVLEEMLRLAAEPHPDIYPRVGERVSIVTNGTLLGSEKCMKTFERYPLDVLTISSDVGAGLHIGVPLTPILRNARKIKEIGGCRQILLATVYTGDNVEAILDLYDEFRWTIGSVDNPFIVQVFLEERPGELTYSKRAQEGVRDLLQRLIEHETGLMKSFVQGSIGAIGVELPYDLFLHMAGIEKLPRNTLMACTNMRLEPGCPTAVSICGINPNGPYLGALESGEIATFREILLSETEAGAYAPGRFRRALRKRLPRQRNKKCNQSLAAGRAP